MLQKIGYYLIKILISFFMLYGYNIIVPSAALIPIYIITVLIIAFLSVPGLLLLIIFKLLIY